VQNVFIETMTCMFPSPAGELQFSFVCFLIGNVYEGFEHWKRLLALLCRAENSMRSRGELYLGLIGVLYHQLGEIPPDFFVDIVSQDNFLTSTLQVASHESDPERLLLYHSIHDNHVIKQAWQMAYFIETPPTSNLVNAK